MDILWRHACAWLAMVAMLGMVLFGTIYNATGLGLPTRHVAKERTFGVLLGITEQQPDVIDATHAAITVGGCVRILDAWRCRGALTPVLISGIPTSCPYVIYVYRTRTQIRGDC